MRATRAVTAATADDISELKTDELAWRVGFASPLAGRTISKRRRGVELFATLALAVSLIVAATAVSIGVARAQTFHALIIHL